MKYEKMVCAIDPGLSGAIVVTDGLRTFDWWPMPTVTDGKNRLVDFKGVYDCLGKIRARRGPIHVFLERAVPMAQGAKSAFSYGRGFEALTISIGLCAFPVTLVEPSRWAKEIHEGISSDLRPKRKSAIAIKRLFPALSIPADAKGPLVEGFIDAVLIAAYGLRKLGAAVAPVKDDVGDFY